MKKRGFTIVSIIFALLLIIPSSAVAPSAKDGNWKHENIISDYHFWNTDFMTESNIQTFLNEKGQDCKKNGSIVCIKDYRQTTRSIKKDAYCPKDLPKIENASTAQIIKMVSNACNISEQVILVTLQKEQGSITAKTPNSNMYKTAMGYACPDSGSCDSKYFGLFNQIYMGSRAFNVYRIKGDYGKRPNQSVKIAYHPNVSKCGTKSVTPVNWATAALYIYTPYIPNTKSQKAGYGTGDSCSSYGNRNFFNYYNDWFGSSRSGRPKDFNPYEKFKKKYKVKKKLTSKFHNIPHKTTIKYRWYYRSSKGKNVTLSWKKSVKPIKKLRKLRLKIKLSKTGYWTKRFYSKWIKIY